MKTKLIGFFVLAVHSAPSILAQTTLANLAGNYGTSGFPLSDSFGTGTWTYDASVTQNPSSLTQLTFEPTVGNAGNSGYADAGNVDSGFAVPLASDLKLFTDGASPASNQLAWHPASNGPSFAVLQWTAGAGEAGPIEISGAFSRIGEPGGTPDFFIYVNGALAFSVANGVAGNSYSFDLTNYSITAGETVDFVLGNNGGFGGEESLIGGSISAIPEPSAYTAIIGLLALGAAFVRGTSRRRKIEA